MPSLSKHRFLHHSSYVWVLFFLAFLIPEVYVHLDYNDWITEKSVGKMAAFIVLGIFCVLSLGSWAGRLLVFLLWLAQLTQVMHHQFFQRFYNGVDVSLVFLEATDMAESMFGMWRLSLPVLLIALISLTLLIIAAYLSQRSRKTTICLVIALLILGAHSANQAKKSLWKAEPAFHQLAVHNAINAIVAYLANFALGEPPQHESFLPYVITPNTQNLKPNIIFIIGESINPAHLGVMGYNRDTTPQLAQLMQTFPSQKKTILSAGVTTRVSTPMLLAVNREPKHIARYKTRSGQLISQAKDGGYYTALIASQTLDFMSAVSVMSDYDLFVDRAQNKKLYDENFVDFLKTLPVNEKPTFTVLNIRSPHMPYADHVPVEIALYSKDKTGDIIIDTRNEYDDALRTADAILSESINTLITRDNRPTLIVMTSDHGEEMGEVNGRFGHNRVNKLNASVPLLVIAANWPNNITVPSINCVENHYQLGVYLLAAIGFTLENPNQKDNTFYINGNDIYGNNGELAYEVPACISNE